MAQAILYGHPTPGYARLAQRRIVRPQLNPFTDRQRRDPNMCQLLQAYFNDDAVEHAQRQAVRPVNLNTDPDYKAWFYEDPFLVEFANKSISGRNLSRLPYSLDTAACGLNAVLGLFIPGANFISALPHDSQIDPNARTIRCTCLGPDDSPIHCKTLNDFVRHFQGSGPHDIRARGPNQSTAIDSLFKWNMDNDFSLDLCGNGESSSQTFYDVKSRYNMIHVVPKPTSDFLEDPIYMMLRLRHPNKNRSGKESSSIVVQRIFLEVFYVGNPVTIVAKEHLQIGFFHHQSTAGFAAPLKDTEWMSLEEFNDFERLKNVQHVYNIKFLRSIKMMVVFRSKLPPNYQIHITLSGWHVDDVHENKFYKPIGCLCTLTLVDRDDITFSAQQHYDLEDHHSRREFPSCTVREDRQRVLCIQKSATTIPPTLSGGSTLVDTSQPTNGQQWFKLSDSFTPEDNPRRLAYAPTLANCGGEELLIDYMKSCNELVRVLVDDNVLSIGEEQWPHMFGVDLDGESFNTRKVYNVNDQVFIDTLPTKVTECRILVNDFLEVVQTVSDKWLRQSFGRGLKSEWCHQVDKLLSSLKVNEEQAQNWFHSGDDRSKSQAKREEKDDQYRADAQVRYEEVNVQIGVVLKRGRIVQQLVQQLGGPEKLNVRPEFSIDLFRRCNSTVDRCAEIFGTKDKDEMRREWDKMMAQDKRLQTIYELSDRLWDNDLNCILEYSVEFMRMIHMAEERHQAIRETCVCDNDPILEAGHALEVQQNPNGDTQLTIFLNTVKVWNGLPCSVSDPFLEVYGGTETNRFSGKNITKHVWFPVDFVAQAKFPLSPDDRESFGKYQWDNDAIERLFTFPQPKYQGRYLLVVAMSKADVARLETYLLTLNSDSGIIITPRSNPKSTAAGNWAIDSYMSRMSRYFENAERPDWTAPDWMFGFTDVTPFPDGTDKLQCAAEAYRNIRDASPDQTTVMNNATWKNWVIPLLIFLNDNKVMNPEQVEYIIRCVYFGHNSPIICNGVPGGGKTTMLAMTEVARILMKDCTVFEGTAPRSRSLIVCATNRATNEAAEKTIRFLDEMKKVVSYALKEPEIKAVSVIRVYAERQHIGLVPDTVKPFCNLINDVDSIPSVAEGFGGYFPGSSGLQACILTCVCTFATVGYLTSIGPSLSEGLFNHIVLDEGGRVGSDELVTAIGPHLFQSTIGQDRTSMAILGDPKQPGVFFRTEAKTCAGEIIHLQSALSLVEGHRETQIVRLCTSYRCQPQILNLWSGVYHPEAKSIVTPFPYDTMENLRSPLLFFDIPQQSETQEGTSWSNVLEVCVVKAICELSQGDMRMRGMTGGVMVHYKNQLQYVKRMLHAFGGTFGGVKWSVQTHLGWQGSECDVMIVCMTQTTGLHFTNVQESKVLAFSRPKSHVLLIGNERSMRQAEQFSRQQVWIKAIDGSYTALRNQPGCEQFVNCVQRMAKQSMIPL